MTATFTPEGHAAAHVGEPNKSLPVRVLDRIAHVVLTILLVALVALAAAVAVVPRVTGSIPLTVLTGSMVPTYNPGDLVVVRPTDPSELAVGDVVTFQPVSGDPTLVTHRIVELEHDAGALTSVVTQGDANGAADAPLQPQQIQGRVWYHVPHIGHVMLNASPLWIGATAGLALVAYAVYTLARPENDDSPTTPEEPS